MSDADAQQQHWGRTWWDQSAGGTGAGSWSGPSLRIATHAPELFNPQARWMHQLFREDMSRSAAFRAIMRLFGAVAYRMCASGGDTIDDRFVRCVVGFSQCATQPMRCTAFSLELQTRVDDGDDDRVDALMQAATTAVQDVIKSDAKTLLGTARDGVVTAPFQPCDLVPNTAVLQALLASVGLQAASSVMNPFAWTPASTDAGCAAPCDTHITVGFDNLEPRTLWSKYTVPYQLVQMAPDYPLRDADDPERDATLRRIASTPRATSGAADTDDLSLWERVMVTARAQRHKMSSDEPAYCAWAAQEVSALMCSEVPPIATSVPASELGVLSHRDGLTDWRLPCVDASLSPLATWVASLCASLESYYFVHSCHSQILLLFVAGLDCFRECRPGDLHLNILFAGPPSSSKSFACSVATDILPRGLVSSAVKRTKSAFQYSADQGSRFILEDETSRSQWSDAEGRGSNTADDDTVAQRKQILTEHKVVVEQCLMVEGKRTQVIATSRLQGSFVCSTNELSASTLDAGLISRFTVITPSSKRTREKHKTVQGIFRASLGAGSDPAVRQGRTQTRTVANDMFKRCAVVSRLLAVDAIQPIDLGAASAVLESYSKMPGRVASARALDRCIQVAAHLCVIDCIATLFCLPDSPFAGQCINPADRLQRQAIQALLVTTTEHGVAALGLLQHELLSTDQTRVIMALANGDLEPNPTDPGYVTLACLGAGASGANGNPGAGGGYRTKRKNFIEEVASLGSVTAERVASVLHGLAQADLLSPAYTLDMTAAFGCSPIPGNGARRQRRKVFKDPCWVLAEALQPCVGKKDAVTDPVSILSSFQCGPTHARAMTMLGVHGVSHLMQCIDMPPFEPYTMQLAFLPQSHAHLLGSSAGGAAAETISSDRQHKTRHVSRPVECANLSKRLESAKGLVSLLGLVDADGGRAVFTQRYGHGDDNDRTYPQDYVD